MKLFVLSVVAALVVGTVYHAEISDYVAGLADGFSGSGGGTSVVDSIRDMGNSEKALIGGVGNVLDR